MKFELQNRQSWTETQTKLRHKPNLSWCFPGSRLPQLLGKPVEAYSLRPQRSRSVLYSSEGWRKALWYFFSQLLIVKSDLPGVRKKITSKSLKEKLFLCYPGERDLTSVMVTFPWSVHCPFSGVCTCSLVFWDSRCACMEKIPRTLSVRWLPHLLAVLTSRSSKIFVSLSAPCHNDSCTVGYTVITDSCVD